MIFLSFLVITFAGWLLYCVLTLPDIDQAVARTRQPSTTITAENGNEVKTFGSVYSEVIRLNELPSYVPDAIISTEDRRFYAHFGFDIVAFTRAMLTNIFMGRYAQGGSTITQQVAKNLFLTSQKNIKRKTQELLLAFWLEHKFSKEQILTLYLNRVYLGAGTYGIEAASQKYFQKSSRDMNLLEAAIIAGMLKAPSRYNPIASAERAKARAKVVLQNMVNNDALTERQMKYALTLPVGEDKSYKVQGADYFADWVYREVNDYIGERDNDIYVYTTLDQKIQENAEKILREAVLAAKNRNVSEGAVVVLNKSGEVKAMVGGIDYRKSQFNRAVTALRQPGSAFKPFVYLTALQNGWKREDRIDDVPLSIGKWKPENYDKKYYGSVTLDEALMKSLNLATVNLSESLSRKDIIRTAKKMGISTPVENTPSLALGTFEVKVIDMATAYSAIANGGYATWPHAIKEIYTRDGYQLYQREADTENRILDAGAVKDLTKMLEKVISQGTGRRAKIPGFAAGKTGTTQDYRDAWFVGFTDEYVIAVWVGNDDNSPMKGVTGGTLPAEIWRKIALSVRE
ncbi:MAG: transglycosylase domain-containing protein [Alphaproteobacteria bacterium]|uniref:transglycosylase domain-containing protein n=1 Tax=Candidatus Scatocola faecigallinarum TaxID=2840916 RepID=UPI001B404E76|nr:PBP1A family penicillin-binding protein [Alphaproteobacteria bacterium]